MTRKQARKYEGIAKKEQKSGDYVVAGEYYSQAAFESVGSGTFSNGSDGSDLRYLLNACTCYRIGNAEQWCRSRAQIGELLAEELAVRAFSKPEPSNAFDQAQRGVWYEFVGDFRTVGRLGDANIFYEKAKETYRLAGDPTTGSAEQPHMAILSYFDSVADAAGANMNNIHQITTNQPFSEWVEYKQEQLPKYLEKLDQNSTFPPG